MPATPAETFDLTGRVALVTGASRGLGARMAEALAGAGADLLVTSRSPEDVARVADTLAETYGIRAVGVAGDLTAPGFPDELVRAAVDRLGGLHILVNNAGVNVRGPIEDVTEADYDHVMAVNARAPWLLCRAAAGVLKEQRYGRVINISSALGRIAIADRTLYCSSKGALEQLTRALAVEWAPFGITVNAVCPGPFATEMNRPLLNDPEQKALFAGYTPMNRWGELHEIGPAVLFLASDAAGYVTGTMLSVDGGWVTW